MVTVLKWIPARLRLWLYLLLSYQLSFDEIGSIKVYFFRFGIPIVLKRSYRTVSTEADALKFLNQAAPNLPIPRLLDSFQLDDKTYTLMTKLPGRDLTRIHRDQGLTEAEMEVIAKDIVSILDQLWRIPQPPELAGQVMISASGHGLPHPASFRERMGGPYPSIYHLYQTISPSKPLESHPPGTFTSIFADPIVWTHTDLTMRNVMIKNGRVSGIIDWEDSGWLPRHWILHNLRIPRPGCEGAWARYWLWTHRFAPEVEEPYTASTADGILLYYLR
ncbi:kinase-like domain-containing protein [Irpex lacteus]|nr:kinase-like domain-containing protein [Irpex lacteus]